MSRSLYGLTIASAILGGLCAIIFVGIGVALPALYAIGAGIAVAIMARAEWQGWVPAVVAIALGVLGILGTMEEIATENGTIDFGMDAPVGQALTVTACLALALVPVAMNWRELQPWLLAVAIGAPLVAIALAFGFAGSLGDQGTWPAFVVGAFAFATIAAPAVLIRQE